VTVKEISMRPIGFIRSVYTDTTQIPKGPGASHNAEGVLEIASEFEEGLMDIEGFSHVFVVWLFDRSDGFDLTGKPPLDDRIHGVFATRSPRRPNPIGLTVVELLRRDGRRLHVRGVDMLDGTPILDIKPYLSSVPQDRLKRGWLDEAEARRQNEAEARRQR
jgi:tRNA (adenine37-N6)-methyltransferase